MKSQLHIKGMYDASCEVKIREQLKLTAGVHKVDVTFHGETANVDYDDAVVQEKTLLKKIQDLGYQATVADEPQADAKGA